MKDNIAFNEMADYYDQYRPDYPREIIKSIIQKAQLVPSSRILEIGAGSGKATAQFVDYGFELLCIEPGKDLAEKGMNRFKDKKVNFVVSLFEDCPLPASHFDAVISAQAFHWVKKPDAYALCAHCLKRNGFLMPFWNIEMIDDSEIDRKVSDIISKYGAYTAVMQKEAYPKRVESISADIENSGYFSRPEVMQIEWQHCFTADEYFGYFMTGNVFIRNTAEKKQACHKELKDLEAAYGGIPRRFISELYISQKTT